MRNKEEFDLFLDQLLGNAVKEFKSTAQYAFLRERLEEMEENCGVMLQDDEKEFAVECFGLIRDAEQQEKTYVYHKAFQDCVSVLRWMGVLA